MFVHRKATLCSVLRLPRLRSNGNFTKRAGKGWNFGGLEAGINKLRAGVQWVEQVPHVRNIYVYMLHIVTKLGKLSNKTNSSFLRSYPTTMNHSNILLFIFVGFAIAQSQLWGQCEWETNPNTPYQTNGFEGGGQDWKGATTCVAGSTCVYSNPWVSNDRKINKLQFYWYLVRPKSSFSNHE